MMQRSRRRSRMTVRQISPSAYQLTRLGLVNAYLVRESDGWTLIDTMFSGSARPILRAAHRIAPGEALARILLTHAHVDHVGSVDRLVNMLGQVEVAISERDARLLAKKPAQDFS